MSLKEKVEQEMVTAMKAKDKDSLKALRAVKSAILLAQTEKGGADGLDAQAEAQLLSKLVKQRKESAEIFAREGRDDLANGELAEIAVIERFLPEQLSDDQVEAIIKAIVERTGAASMKDMGKVMAEATKELAGKTDNKLVSALVKKLLGA